MNKPIVKNWMKYWASALAISGMLVLGSCNSEPEREEVETPEIETVTREVEEEEYAEEEVAVVETETVQQDQNVTANRNWNQAGWSGANISKLLNEYPEVNEAIRTTLASMTNEPGEYNMPQQDTRYTNYDVNDATLPGNSQAINMDAEGDDYAQFYNVYLDPTVELSPEERQFLEEAKRDYDQRRQSMSGQMDPQTGAYFAPMVVARPDVNMSELIEEIKEETKLPQELEDAKMEGTVLVQFVVDEEGEITSAEVIDGVIRQVKEDGTLMSFIRLSDRTQSEIKEEIEKEDLIEFKGEAREKLIEAMEQESLRVMQENSAKWQPATQNDEPVKMVMIMPIRFTIDD